MGFHPRNVHLPNPRQIRERFQPEGTSAALLGAWAVSSILALIIPVCKWAVERNKYYGYYGRYNEYNYQQEQYNGNGNYNNGGNGYYNLCSWWNLSCKYKMKRYQQMYGNGEGGGGGGGEQGNMAAMLPGWYFFFGGSMQREGEGGGEGEGQGTRQNEGSMKFVYSCTIVMFLALAVFGFRSMYAGKDRMGVIAALLIFGMFSLMNLLTTVQGTIETDNRFFENSVYGWFGQWSVLVACTDFWLMLHCFGFAGLLGAVKCIDGRATRAAAVSAPAPDASYNLEDGAYKQDENTVATEHHSSYNAPS